MGKSKKDALLGCDPLSTRGNAALDWGKSGIGVRGGYRGGGEVVV